jgi:hypothetical protein
MSFEEILIVVCPHCQEPVTIHRKEINCAIFRHAVFKTSFQPIPPHASQVDCERWLEKGEVYGCAKPFRLVKKDDTYVAEVCDYI